MKTMKIKRLCVLVLLMSVVLPACAKPTEPPAETDWREQYGTVANTTVTPGGEEPTGTLKPTAKPTKKPVENDITSIELPFPTPMPVRDFVPQEGQVELRLWMFEMLEDCLDEYILAELNHILQERGCSFYLTRRIEPRENTLAQISLWQEALDAGEAIDLLYFGNEDIGKAYKKYGNTAIVRAIKEGYLLPFSEYPETEAKERLLAAYPEEYWELCSFKGENYGVSNSVSSYVKKRNCLMLNLDAAEQAGIAVPESLDVLKLDDLLMQAEEAGIPGMSSVDVFSYCGIKSLYSGLYVKYLEEGKYRIVNPLEDEAVVSLWDTLYRYKEKGWEATNTSSTGEIPLVLYETLTVENWDGERFYKNTDKGEVAVRVKIYEESERFFVSANYNMLLGISSSSQHKEEALELLSLMQGDEEIVQLLRYGIEGVHYRIGEEGLENMETSEVMQLANGNYRVENKTKKSPARTTFGKKYDMFFGNHLMCVPLEEQIGKENREEEWYTECADIAFIPYLEEFNEEQKEIQKRIKDLTYIEGKQGEGIRDISGSLITLNSDYKLQIEKLRTAFAEAGYNELAREVNGAHGLD